MRPLDDYIAHWKLQAVKQVDVDVGDRATREARQLAEILARSYSAKRVYLFGSLARRDTRFARTSDIDLVVEGLPPDCFYEALGDLLTRSDFMVDLKPLEGLCESLRSRIGQEGILLYG